MEDSKPETNDEDYPEIENIPEYETPEG